MAACAVRRSYGCLFQLHKAILESVAIFMGPQVTGTGTVTGFTGNTFKDLARFCACFDGAVALHTDLVALLHLSGRKAIKPGNFGRPGCIVPQDIGCATVWVVEEPVFSV